MRLRQLLSPLLTAAVFAVLALTLSTAAWARPKYKVLHAFNGGNDGGGLWGSLLLDRQGNVYGTTIAGGSKGKGGTVFKLSRQANGTWTQTVLYSFCSLSNCTDGGGSTAGLIFDAAGNLYGTTQSGGAHVYGTVFELTPGVDGWKETVLHSFGFNSQGCCPKVGVVMDSAGNLFGTASVAFELSHGSDGWEETVLHHFPSYKGDGNGPFAVILDGSGNLYGVTTMGGTSKRCGSGCGTAYELQRTSSGWKEHILHDFGTSNDGMVFPGGTLLQDGGGRLYGTSYGDFNGVVYRLSRGSNGTWKAAIQYRFTGGANGGGPSGGVVMDKLGNLYGTTTVGGDPNCDCGVAYKLSPSPKGKWTYSVLHRFTGYDGAQPGELILDKKGNLYGTTITGGAGGYGVAFELTP
jgi:uncharacterized repeat protein (TIGR03803 family)